MWSVRNRKNGTAMAGLVGLAVLAASCAAPATLGQNTSMSGASGAVSATASTGPSVSMASSSGVSTTTTSPAAAQRTSPRTSAAPRPTSAVATPVTPSASPQRTLVYGTPTHPIRVQVTGMVLANSRGQVVMCPPFPDGLVGTTSPVPPTLHCLLGKPVTGVDMHRVSLSSHNSTHRWGQTHIEGTWDGSRLVATSQRLPADTDRFDDIRLPEGVPCTAPSGGWPLGATQEDLDIEKIKNAVGRDFGMLMMGYPNGFPKNSSGDLTHTAQVVIVGVTGDQRAATAAIRKVFRGNLCVVHSDTTDVEIQGQNDAIRKALGDKMDVDGVMTFGGLVKTAGTQTTVISIVVDTPEFEAKIASIPGPPITINPWIIPVP